MGGCGSNEGASGLSATFGMSRGRRFEPCEWSDLSCHALVDIAGKAGTPLTGIVGHHKNAGTWLKGYAEAEAGASAASPYLGTALRGLHTRLRHDTWATLVRSTAPCSFHLQSTCPLGPSLPICHGANAYSVDALCKCCAVPSLF